MFKKMTILFILSLLIFNPVSYVLADNNSISTSQTELTASDLFSEALAEYNKQDFKAASVKFDQLLADYQLDEGLEFSALYYASMTAVKNLQTQKAISRLEMLEERGYQSADLNWRIGELFLNKNNQFDSADFASALKYLKKAAELGKETLAFKRDLAGAYLETDKTDTAKQIYQEIIAADPTAADYVYLAKIMEKENKNKKAVEYYEKAIELDSEQQSVYLNLGNLYQKLNNYAAAISTYKKGIENKNNFTPYYIGLGESYFALEEYAAAQKALEKAIEINHNSYYGYFLLGNIAKQAKNYNQALNYYDKSLQYNPDYVEAYLAEGQVQLEKEAYYQAISKFSLAVDKNPEYAESRYYLGLAYYRAEMMEASRSELRKALHIDDTYQPARKLLDKVENILNIK